MQFTDYEYSVELAEIGKCGDHLISKGVISPDATPTDLENFFYEMEEDCGNCPHREDCPLCTENE